MRQFIKRALNRLEKLSPDQFRELLLSASGEITRLETVIDSLPRGILVCDNEHKLILANKSARRFLSILSYERGRDQGRENVWSLINDDKISDFLSATILATDKAEEREFHVMLGGMDRLLSISLMPLVEEQRISGSLILVDDITDRKAREALMRRMESLASLTTLAAGIAHEVKNPLGSISIYVQLIQKAIEVQRQHCPQFDIEGEFHSTVDRYLTIVNEEVERLNSIVVDFLFAVRPINIETKKTDINSLIRELAEFVSVELEEAGIECRLDLDDKLPLLDLDEKLIKQAILNLIQNASAAIAEKSDSGVESVSGVESDSGVESVSGGILSISTGNREGEAEITIEDNGIGIAEENIGKIFEPYYTTKKTGTGLGLTLTFRIIREHKGDIGVKSNEGEGTVFSILLPLPRAVPNLIPYKAASSSEVPS